MVELVYGLHHVSLEGDQKKSEDVGTNLSASPYESLGVTKKSSRVIKLVIRLHHGRPKVVKLKLELHYGCPNSEQEILRSGEVSTRALPHKSQGGGIHKWTLTIRISKEVRLMLKHHHGDSYIRMNW